MSFSPVVPMGGYAGWAFLTRTIDAQKKAFVGDATVQRDEAYFRDKIGKVTTADQLVDDRRLLTVVLTAYGLEKDINNKAFLKRILNDGTIDPAALGNKLADKRYLAFSAAMNFGDLSAPNTLKPGFADTVLQQYEARSFEAALGAQNEDMRLSLNAKRELAALATSGKSENAKWFTALGSPPLRQVLQTALGLPKSFTSVDIDKQLTILKERANSALGSSDLAQFSDPAKVEKLVRLYLVRAQLQANPVSSGNVALSLLQNNTSGSGLSLYL